MALSTAHPPLPQNSPVQLSPPSRHFVVHRQADVQPWLLPTPSVAIMTAKLPATTTTPLARRTLHAPESIPSLLYHLLALALCLFTQHWALQLAPLQFLLVMWTLWSGFIQLAYFVLYCTAALLSLTAGTAAADVVGGLRCVTSLLMSAMFLSTFGTALIFWCIYSYDNRLMVPEGFVYDLRLNRQPTAALHSSTGEGAGDGTICVVCCVGGGSLVYLGALCACVPVVRPAAQRTTAPRHHRAVRIPTS